MTSGDTQKRVHQCNLCVGTSAGISPKNSVIGVLWSHREQLANNI